MWSINSLTETTGFRSPHNAGCGAAAGGDDDLADEQERLPAPRAATAQATRTARLTGMCCENTPTYVVQTFRSAVRAGLKACTTPGSRLVRRRREVRRRGVE